MGVKLPALNSIVLSGLRGCGVGARRPPAEDRAAADRPARAEGPAPKPPKGAVDDDLTLRMGAGGEPVGGSFWEEVGGRPTFEKLVRALLRRRRATDEVLLADVPGAADLEGAIQRLTGFLEQYWGGPGTYSEERGHPRLRMRHLPFAVTPDARDRWLRAHARRGRHARAVARCTRRCSGTTSSAPRTRW